MKTFDELDSNGKIEAMKFARKMLFSLVSDKVLELSPKGFKEANEIVISAAENARYIDDQGKLKVIFEEIVWQNM